MRMARKFFFPIRRNQVNFWSTSKAEKKKKKKKKKKECSVGPQNDNNIWFLGLVFFKNNILHTKHRKKNVFLFPL